MLTYVRVIAQGRFFFLFLVRINFILKLKYFLLNVENQLLSEDFFDRTNFLSVNLDQEYAVIDKTKLFEKLRVKFDLL
jgi:hypothetical protein